MPTSRIPSPARSQGAVSTPRRYKPRGPRSVGSPARSDVSGRLTSIINMHKNNSFALSPMPSRRSVLADNTDIEEPKRRSWWRQLGENSRDVLEVIESNKASTEANNMVEDLIEMEVLSQEKKSYILDLPESSDSESIHSIIMPQRKLFKQKENEVQNKFGQLVGNRETLSKLHKSSGSHDKSINVGPRELFNTNKQRTKPIFPAALLDISLNKTSADKTKENIKELPKNQARNIFGNRAATKRKNMFAEFVVSESEDEIPEIQPKVFGFSRKSDQKSRGSTTSRGKREPSPASSLTTDMEMDDWKMLPSSTMVAEQLEDAALGTPVKRARLSKLSEAKESEAGTNSNTTVDKTKQSNKSTSSKNKSKSTNNAKEKSLELDRSMRTRNASKAMQNNSHIDMDNNALDNAVTSKNISSNKSKNSNSSLSKLNSKKPNKSINDNKNHTLEKSKQNTSKTKTFNVDNHKQKSQYNNVDDIVKHNIMSERDDEIDDNHDNEENNFTLEYESDDQKEVVAQNENNKSIRNKTVTLKTNSNITENVRSTVKNDVSFKKLQSTTKKTIDETEESQILKENELGSSEIHNHTKIHAPMILKRDGADTEICDREQTVIVNHVEVAKNANVGISHPDFNNIQSELKLDDMGDEQMDVDEIGEGTGKSVDKEPDIFNKIHRSMPIDQENGDVSQQDIKERIASQNTRQLNGDNERNSQMNRFKDKNDTHEHNIQENKHEHRIAMEHQTTKVNETKAHEGPESEKSIKQLQNKNQNANVAHDLGSKRMEEDKYLEIAKESSQQELENESMEQTLNENEPIEENESEDVENNKSEAEQQKKNKPSVQNEIEQNESQEDGENETEKVEQNDSEEEEDQNEIKEAQDESETGEHDPSEATELNDSEVREKNESEDEEQNESEEEEQNESVANELREKEADEQNESKEHEQHESDADARFETETEELKESEDEEKNESVANALIENEADEPNESKEDERHESDTDTRNETETEEPNESEDEEQNESEEMQNESQEDIEEQSEEETQNESHEEEVNESYVGELNESGDEEETQNEAIVMEHNKTQDQIEDIIEKTDTPNSSGIKSPEAILHDKTNQADSFTAQGRNTSVRKSKSMIKPLNIRPSIAPPRDSFGLSEASKDSSAEGSGWDSHRTTRKTLRHTFGKDFTPRKSLRALVMEKSAKRQTAYMDARSEITTLPQANSTEYPEVSNHEHYDDESMEKSDHEASRRMRQATLEMCLQEIKKKNMERRQKTEMEVNNLFKPSAKDNNSFKVPARPMFASRRVTKQVQKKSKPKQINSLIPLDNLPPEILDDMKYKPPKRFQPNNASWITKRLYKFLETKLEPKYDYKARVRAEKLVETIYDFAKELRRHQRAPAGAVHVLKHEMARLDIVKTHFEFYEFFNDFMPREIRVKVIPDIVNKIPMPKHGIFSEIQV